jgi:sugar lactone lactonase YvrE
MSKSTTIKTALAAGAYLYVLSAFCALAAPSEVTVDDTNVFPESITSTADGSVIFGSSTKPIIYRSDPGAATAEPWIHVTGDGAGTNGVLVNAASHTLWACVHEPVPNAARIPGQAGQAPRIPQRSYLRGFDLTTGAVKSNYPLVGDTNGCNDIAVGLDHSVYVTDAPNARLERLAPGGAALQVWYEDKQNLDGLDGVDVMDGKIYANNIRTGKIYRIPVGADGKAAPAVEIQLSRPLTGPDGMRSAGGRMYVADNRANQVDMLVFNGDSATVTLLKSGYQTPTAVSPTGDTLWVGEAKFNYRRDPSLGDPNPFKAYALPIPK